MHTKNNIVLQQTHVQKVDRLCVFLDLNDVERTLNAIVILPLDHIAQ